MFDRLYMGVLDMSKTAAMVITVVLLVRLLLKKAPKVFSYALWAVVLFRLLCPFSFETPVSIVPQLPDTSTGYNLADESIDLAGAGMAAYQAVGDLLNGGLGVQHIPTTDVTEDGMTRYVMADLDPVRQICLGSRYGGDASLQCLLLPEDQKTNRNRRPHPG